MALSLLTRPTRFNVDLSPEDQATIRTLVEKIPELKARRPDLAKIDFRDLARLLTKTEIDLINELKVTDAKELGFLGPHFSFHGTWANFKTIEGQGNLPIVYLTFETYKGFQALKEGLKVDFNCPLWVRSGYRSPAYQALVFFMNLVENQFDIRVTASKVALPGYSEHGRQPLHALDFATDSERPFGETEVYYWLRHNAGAYGWEESYPIGNTVGVGPEPWHWRLNRFHINQ